MSCRSGTGSRSTVISPNVRSAGADETRSSPCVSAASSVYREGPTSASISHEHSRVRLAASLKLEAEKSDRSLGWLGGLPGARRSLAGVAAVAAVVVVAWLSLRTRPGGCSRQRGGSPWRAPGLVGYSRRDVGHHNQRIVLGHETHANDQRGDATRRPCCVWRECCARGSIRARLPDHAGARRGDRRTEPVAAGLRVTSVERARERRARATAAAVSYAAASSIWRPRSVTWPSIGSPPTRSTSGPTCRFEAHRGPALDDDESGVYLLADAGPAPPIRLVSLAVMR